MIDMEKVVKGIRKCLSRKPCSENGCPYENECAVEHPNDPLLRDSLTLLKEQEEIIKNLKMEKLNELKEELNCLVHEYHEYQQKEMMKVVKQAVKWDE